MGTVTMHSVVSADGFIADGNDGVGPLHDWYFSRTSRLRHQAVRGGDQPASSQPAS
jgi:hypothetical protein